MRVPGQPLVLPNLPLAEPGCSEPSGRWGFSKGRGISPGVRSLRYGSEILVIYFLPLLLLESFSIASPCPEYTTLPLSDPSLLSWPFCWDGGGVNKSSLTREKAVA